jgi:hypothetical protein
MGNSEMNNTGDPYYWEEVPSLLKKMQALGWVRSASHVRHESGSGTCTIDFTPEGVAALKPFADFWKAVGSLTAGETLGLFNVAVLSQKQ